MKYLIFDLTRTYDISSTTSNIRVRINDLKTFYFICINFLSKQKNLYKLVC